ncbi:MAG: peptidylprolyl isomerase, partial [Clostridia bacterium]|nr:peptidylprolyl isomerase [Clostridia bacterium]
APMLEQMKDLPDYFPAETQADYAEIGGTPWLDYHHTVFGQVVEGMEVVDAIAAVAVDGNDKPLTPVVIERIKQ